jgi:hypothetical protein
MRAIAHSGKTTYVEGSSRTLPVFEFFFDYQLKSDQKFGFKDSCS